MLLQKQRKSSFTIRALVIGTLAFGTWFHPLHAYGMGPGEKIDGSLESLHFGHNVGGCVDRGVSRTGLGVEAISYTGSNLRCETYHDVNNLLPDVTWCSTWVVLGSPDLCSPPPPPAPPSTSLLFLNCWAGKLPLFEFSFWAGAGGGPVDYFEVERYSGGSWQPWYDGPFDCINTTGSATGIPFRVRAVNISGISVWVNVLLIGSCGGGGPL